MQKAPSVYDRRITALIAIAYVALVTLRWGWQTLARSRFARSSDGMPNDGQKRVAAGLSRAIQ